MSTALAQNVKVRATARGWVLTDHTGRRKLTVPTYRSEASAKAARADYIKQVKKGSTHHG